MLMKCILLLSALSVLDAQYGFSRPCIIPRINHGRARSRMRSKMIKYICSPGYTLSGNRYSTCKNGQWDTPVPICIKPGCVLPSDVENALMLPSLDEAWVVFFCFPGHRLVGSPAIYCDGRHWNASAPVCVDSAANTNLSCNFETPDLCGWKQDALHDFDWERLNKKTPSAFLSTGPSYDHTYGQGGSGYYMYIESSSRMENDTARLVSPIYGAELANDGCFQFFYHMFGRHTGGLRVYQKPDNIGMELMLRLPDNDRQKYQLFEQWGNQGDIWYGEVAPLKNFSVDFQIVIEGIRGKKFTSDIAIDDVAILQGENCSVARREVTTPAVFLPDSCDGRCTNSTEPQIGCSCHLTCLLEENCCQDFFELCVYNSSDNTSDDPDLGNITIALPQTQKLIKTTTPITTTVETTTATPRRITTAVTTKAKKITTTPKPTPPVTLRTTIPATTKANSTTPRTIFQKDAIKDNSTSTDKAVKPNILKGTNTTTTTVMTKPIPKTTKAVTTKKTTVFAPTTKATIRKVTTVAPKVTKTSKAVFHEKTRLESRTAESKKGSAWKTILITAITLVCIAGLLWLVVGARGARGRAALDYLRGRTRHDPEVRYLHSSENDDDF